LLNESVIAQAISGTLLELTATKIGDVDRDLEVLEQLVFGAIIMCGVH